MGKMISLDFSGVEDGFKNVEKPGKYNVKITKVEAKKGKDSGKPYLNWELQVLDGEYKGARLWYITSLSPQALFNLRNLLTAAGIEVPKSMVKIDLDSVIGRIVTAKVIMETYNGEERPKVKEVIAAQAITANDDFDDELDTDTVDMDEDEIDLDGLDL